MPRCGRQPVALRGPPEPKRSKTHVCQLGNSAAPRDQASSCSLAWTGSSALWAPETRPTAAPCPGFQHLAKVPTDSSQPCPTSLPNTFCGPTRCHVATLRRSAKTPPRNPGPAQVGLTCEGAGSRGDALPEPRSTPAPSQHPHMRRETPEKLMRQDGAPRMKKDEEGRAAGERALIGGKIKSK